MNPNSDSFMLCRIRLISLAAQNLIASVAADAYEIQQRRAKERTKPGNEPGRPKENDVVLTSEVLGEALEEVNHCSDRTWMFLICWNTH